MNDFFLGLDYGKRYLSSSAPSNQSEAEPKAELKAQEETQDVMLIDKLMSSISESFFVDLRDIFTGL